MSDLDELFGRYDRTTPGCALAVVRGETASFHAHGLADLERGVPITPSTRFNLGSVSKHFTVFAVLLLEQEGRLSVDDDVRRHVPELNDFGPTITLRHLMHHTSGLRGTYPELLMLGGWRFTDHITHEDCLRLILDQRELSFQPGAEHLYVNSNYVLLAEVVARVSGTSLAEFSRRRIFEPTGMNDTLVMDDVSMVVPNRALGYYEDARRWHNLPLTDSVVGPTNVWSTAEDMARWLVNFRTRNVGGPEVWTRLLAPGTLADGSSLGYAGGLVVGPDAVYRGRPVVKHGGQHGGYCTSMHWFPEDDLGIALMFNHFQIETRDQLLRVADLYLESSEADAVPTPVDERRIEPDPSELEPLSGTFYDPSRRAVREVPFVDGTLTYMGLDLVPIGPGRFAFAADSGVEVTIDDEGLTLETPAGRYEYLRMAPIGTDSVDLAAYAGRYESPEVGVAWRIGVDAGRLVARRHKYADTTLRPLFEDGFIDDWSPTIEAPLFPFDFLVEFERADGEVRGLRVSGDRVRGLWFERTGD